MKALMIYTFKENLTKENRILTTNEETFGSNSGLFERFKTLDRNSEYL